jgi:hypothetical protein
MMHPNEFNHGTEIDLDPPKRRPDGGQAFPVPAADRVHERVPGMTLRDYFAGQVDVAAYDVLGTLRAKLGRHEITVGEVADYIAQIRYIEADAMLAVRGAS